MVPVIIPKRHENVKKEQSVYADVDVRVVEEAARKRRNNLEKALEDVKKADEADIDERMAKQEKSWLCRVFPFLKYNREDMKRNRFWSIGVGFVMEESVIEDRIDEVDKIIRACKNATGETVLISGSALASIGL